MRKYRVQSSFGDEERKSTSTRNLGPRNSGGLFLRTSSASDFDGLNGRNDNSDGSGSYISYDNDNDFPPGSLPSPVSSPKAEDMAPSPLGPPPPSAFSYSQNLAASKLFGGERASVENIFHPKVRFSIFI